MWTICRVPIVSECLRSVAVAERDVRVALGLALRGARRRAGVSQERLAELAGLDRTYVSGVERGVRNPTLLTLVRLCDALGIDLKDLIESIERHQ
jgi:transcriptional regulator with XRE-family HTH domain